MSRNHTIKFGLITFSGAIIFGFIAFNSRVFLNQAIPLDLKTAHPTTFVFKEQSLPPTHYDIFLMRKGRDHLDRSSYADVKTKSLEAKITIEVSNSRKIINRTILQPTLETYPDGDSLISSEIFSFQTSFNQTYEITVRPDRPDKRLEALNICVGLGKDPLDNEQATFVQFVCGILSVISLIYGTLLISRNRKVL